MGKSNIRIWDAGCAMGPEPFSLAILLAEQLGGFAFKNVHIDATDIDRSNQFNKIITDGVYPYKQLKRIPREIFKKYFTKYNSSEEYQIDFKIRKRVKYHRHDLLTLKPVNDQYSLILCKNVLLHLKYEDRVNVIRMFYRVLDHNGILAMEQTQKLPSEVKSIFRRIQNNVQIFEKV